MPREQFEYPLSSLPRLSHFGYSDSIKSYCYGPHFHYGYELIYVTGGSARTMLYQGEEPVLLERDDLCLIPPRQIHEFVYKSEDIVFYWMGFQTGRTVAVADHHMEEPERLLGPRNRRSVGFYENIDAQIEDICGEIPPKTGRLYKNVPRFASLFREISQEIHRADDYAERLIYQKVLEIFLQIARQEQLAAAKGCVQAGESVRLQSRELGFAVEYLKAHCREGVRMEALAQEIGYSKEHFSRLFKTRYGRTPKEYHDNLRLEAAKGELKRGVSVGEAASSCGFSSSSYFSSWFRKQNGISPDLYRYESGKA